MFVSAGVEFVEVIVLVVVAGWVAVAVDSTVFVAAGVGPVAPLPLCPVACPFLTGVSLKKWLVLRTCSCAFLFSVSFVVCCD